MKYKYIFFDLDGTIIDSSEGVVNSAIYALEKYNMNNYSKDQLKEILIGPPLYTGLKNLTNIEDEEIISKLVKAFREDYSSKGVFANTLFPDIKESIIDLYNLGFHLEILTSKPQKFAEQILEQHDIKQYFSKIDGAGEHDKKSSKIEKLGAFVKGKEKKCVMIGDRTEDIIAGNENSIDTIAVTYGFDNIDKLKEENATYYVDSVIEFFDIIKGN